MLPLLRPNWGRSSVRKFLVDLGDRVGSTAVQAFAGSLASASLLGVGDWKAATVAAGSAALLAAVKVFGVQAAKPADPTAVAVRVDEQAVVKAIGDKLKGA